jgi:hypothetical protein
MKKRQFLLPLAVSAASLVGSGTTINASAHPTEGSASQTLPSVTLPGKSGDEPLILSRSSASGMKIAQDHASHASHESHASHASHASGS